MHRRTRAALAEQRHTRLALLLEKRLTYRLTTHLSLFQRAVASLEKQVEQTTAGIEQAEAKRAETKAAYDVAEAALQASSAHAVSQTQREAVILLFS